MADPPPDCTPGYAERCFNSRGPVCRCGCGGAHHGIQHSLEGMPEPQRKPRPPADRLARLERALARQTKLAEHQARRIAQLEANLRGLQFEVGAPE